MRVRELWIVALVAALAACGGGGGGGTTAGPGAPPPTGGTPPPSGGTGAPGAGTSTAKSNATVIFPWRHSGSLASSVIVHGIASDVDGVSAVRVNGAAAIVTPLAAGARASAKTALQSRVLAIPVAAPLANTAPTEVEYSAEVPLAAGDNNVVVTVEDATGDVTAGAGEVAVRYVEVPSLFASDRDDPRLVGWSTVLTPSAELTHLVDFDYASGAQIIYSQLTDVGVASCFRGQTDEFLYVLYGGTNSWQVRSFNLATRQTTPVAMIPAALMVPGPGFSEGPYLIQLVCSSAHQEAYLLADFFDNGSPAKSRVLRIDLAGTVTVLTETDPNESPLWFSTKIALSSDALVSLQDINAVAPLTRISLQDGSRSTLAPITVGGLAMTALLDYDRVFVTTFDGVDLVTLTNPPTKRNISPVDAADPLIFSQANSIGVDLVGNRVIVGDSDLATIVAVDIDTGVRSELLSNKVGAGSPMVAPRRLALTSTGTTAYVADDGGNAAEKLFAVDLGTGDRRIIGQISEQGVNRSLTGLALDEAAGQLFVSRYDGGTVLQIDLATENATAITSSGDGFLDGITDILLDAANGRLLIADAVTDAIVAVDVPTRHKELISRGGERGNGDAFETLTSLTMAENGAALYAADQKTNRIFRVDLATGDRQVVDIPCALGGPETLRQVLYDPATNELLIIADGIFSYDLDTAICTQIPSRRVPLEIRLTGAGQILAGGFNSVMQIDRQSGDVVVVSK